MAYLIWAYCPSLLINPSNFGESKKVVSGSTVEYVFPDQVSNRYPIFCAIYGIVNLIISFLASWMVASNDSTFSEVSLVLKSTNSSVEFDDTEKKEIMQNLKKKSGMIMVLNNIANKTSISKSFLKKNRNLSQNLRRFNTQSQEMFQIKKNKKLKFLSQIGSKSELKDPLVTKIELSKGKSTTENNQQTTQMN
jgi:hypothetical protein